MVNDEPRKSGDPRPLTTPSGQFTNWIKGKVWGIWFKDEREEK